MVLGIVIQSLYHIISYHRDGARPSTPGSILVLCPSSSLPQVSFIMTSWFRSYKGPLSGGDEAQDGDAAVRALPASWYRSSAMFELERRAIFSKKWILVSHQQRLLNIGDYVQITEAGFPFFLIKDKQGIIRAHHNVCRHRAYPIIENENGKASVLACKYHGRSDINLWTSMLLIE